MMDNKFLLRITRYQRLAMEHAKMIVGFERVRDELRIERTARRNVTAHLKLIFRELKQVKRERDAAVADITKAAPCFACKHFKRNGGTCGGGRKCYEKSLEAEYAGEGYAGPFWEWRGVQEVAKYDGP